MLQAKNDRELKQMLKAPIDEMCQYVAEQILKENADVIDEVVYGAGSPSWYERTGQFKSAWSISKPRVKGNVLAARSILMDGRKIRYNADKGQHGSPSWFKNPINAKDYMADIIYQGLSGDAFGDGYWRSPRDAFSIVIQNLDDGKFDQWVEEGLRKVGLR